MIAIVDYGMGNLHSVTKGLETIGADVEVVRTPDKLVDAEGIVLPGVGSFYQGMLHLNELGFIDVLNEEVLRKKKPFLGICLGMHLCAKWGEEYGEREGLGWIDARVTKFQFDSPEFKIPHMGWNDVELTGKDVLFNRLKNPTTFYFVHSYHFVPTSDSVVTGYCDHGGKFVASVSQDNIHLTQFHPEKSQDKGLQVLENFYDLCVVQAEAVSESC